MSKLLELVKFILPPSTEHSRESPGIAAWVTWAGDLNASVAQSFQDYGGTMVAKNEESGLWFFFSVESFMAIARVHLWAKMHKLDVSIVLMPATVYISEASQRYLSLDKEFLEQSDPPLGGFTIWVHPQVAEKVLGTPGFVFEQAADTPSLTKASWLSMYSDSRLTYRTSFGWYCILRPLGDPLEKSFQIGWRNFFAEMENILQRQKFKYTIHDNFLLFPLETLSQFKTWVREYFDLVKRLKEEKPEHYWPCVQAVIDKSGQVFNSDLPYKAGIDWNQMMPNFPHMSFKNAYLLGEDFRMHNVRFEISTKSIENWCNVSLIEEGEEGGGILQIVVPARLVSGKLEQCFYCGMRSHTPAQCPSRQIDNWTPDLWQPVSMMDFDAMNNALRQIDTVVEEDGQEGLLSLVKDGEKPENHIVRAIFDINATLQHHSMAQIWLSRSKDNPRDFSRQSQMDDHPIWTFLTKLPMGELVPLEKELQIIIQSRPRDWRLICLNGFLALERKDCIRAAQLWKDAEGLSANKLQLGYLKFLQARLLEIDGKYEHAGTAYGEVAKICPDWLDPEYRQVVCKVKKGFSEQAIPLLLEVIEKDANFFNKALLDPEMERGHIQLESALYVSWVETGGKLLSEFAALQNMADDIGFWFKADNPFAEKLMNKINSVLSLSGIANYVPYRQIIAQKKILTVEKQEQISIETRELRARLNFYRQRLGKMQIEAAWFPFPRLLGQFTKVFNSVSQSMAWALKVNLQNAENFKKALRIVDKEEERVNNLERQIRFLKVVRDSTLFVLIMGKMLIWLELLALILIFVGLPMLLYYTEKSSLDLTAELLFQGQWKLQKALVIIFSVLALAVSVFRTVSVFEKKRDQLLKKGTEEKTKKK